MSAVSLPSLREFAARYTAAWCSRDASSVADFFAPEGSLTINDGTPAIGRAAIVEAAQEFITAFPDILVYMDDLVPRGERFYFKWTLEGTNSGPGGTGNKVRISGYEDWKIGTDGLIAESLGHFDADEYQRQIEFGVQQS